MDGPSPSPWWLSPRARWLLWLAGLLGSTAVLIGPSLALFVRGQIDSGPNTGLDLHIFLLSKTFHLTDYALLAVLTAWLPVPRRLRGLLLVLLALHAVGTEFVQQYVDGRTATWRDVGLNYVGIVLGSALTWRWWLGDEARASAAC